MDRQTECDRPGCKTDIAPAQCSASHSTLECRLTTSLYQSRNRVSDVENLIRSALDWLKCGSEIQNRVSHTAMCYNDMSVGIMLKYKRWCLTDRSKKGQKRCREVDTFDAGWYRLSYHPTLPYSQSRRIEQFRRIRSGPDRTDCPPTSTQYKPVQSLPQGLSAPIRRFPLCKTDSNRYWIKLINKLLLKIIIWAYLKRSNSGISAMIVDQRYVSSMLVIIQ